MWEDEQQIGTKRHYCSLNNIRLKKKGISRLQSPQTSLASTGRTCGRNVVNDWDAITHTDVHLVVHRGAVERPWFTSKISWVDLKCSNGDAR